MDLVDIWREMNPGLIWTTWSSRHRDERKTVKTRIDRVMIDEKLVSRTTEAEIERTKGSDHDVITWIFQTKLQRMASTYPKIALDLLEDEKYGEEVKKMFEQ